MANPHTVTSLLAAATRQLAKPAKPSPNPGPNPDSNPGPNPDPTADARRDAEVLLAHLLHKPTAWLLGHTDAAVSDRIRAPYQALITRRQQGEPIAYLVGRQEFWSLPFTVTPAVLIPRADTELLVQQGLHLARTPTQTDRHHSPAPPFEPAPSILDLGSGSGAIGLALATELPTATLTLTDLCPAALTVAKHNAAALSLPHIQFAQGDWYAAVAPQRFDLIIANPPYVKTHDPQLDPNVKTFEPAQALFSGPDGLTALTHIVSQAPIFLHPHGWLAVEHSPDQAAAVRKRFQQAGFTGIETTTDLAGLERVTQGRVGGKVEVGVKSSQTA